MLPLHYRDVFLLYMVRPERFELPTSGFEDLLSIQLNYRRIYGGDSWIRANDLLRMKELHYRCAMSPQLAESQGVEPCDPI